MKHTVRLDLRENLAQFSLLVLVNAFVGAMVGMERSILPAIAEEEFHLAASTAILSFIVVFGVTKALTNYFAGRWSDRFGRKAVLVAGWMVAAPVPFLLMWAPSWSWILGATLLSVFAVRETRHHATLESKLAGAAEHDTLSPREVIARTSFTDRDLSSVSQAGMVNNLNDGMAWALFPLIVSGMWTQAAGIVVIALGSTFAVFAAGAVLLGLGTAMVYPTLLAAIGDVPLDALVERVGSLNPDALLVTAGGKGGGRSEQAAGLARELGFSSVRSLCGGTAAWLARRPLSRQGAR